MVDYYKTLEIPRNAILSDIKKAYHRLALKWHPDKNPNNKEEADRRFKEISEAYEVLSDGEKRIIYDQYGKEGLTRDGGRRGPRSFGTDDFFGHSHFVFRDPEEVFREFFGGDPFANFFDPVMTNPSHGSMQTSIFGPTLTMFTGFRGFPDLFGGDPGFTSFSSSLSTGNYGTPSGNIRRTSTSTRFVNGKKIITKRVMENGVETVTVVEDGEVRSKTVNGVPQALGY